MLIRRICRIYLPYAASILLAAAISARLYTTAPTGNSWIDMTWSQPFSPPLLLQHLLMIGHYNIAQLNTVIWSLIVEMRVSLAFPAIVLLTRRIGFASFAALAAVLTPTLAYARTRSGHDMICNTLFFALFFVFGSLLSRRYEDCRRFLAKLTPLQSGLLLLAAYLTCQVCDPIHIGKAPLASPLHGYLCAWPVVLATSVILLVATTFVPFRHLLHHPVLLWAGTRSYSTYLLHSTVLFTFIRLQHGRVLPLSMIVPYLACTWAISELFYRAVERPTMLLSRRLGQQNMRAAATTWRKW